MGCFCDSSLSRPGVSVLLGLRWEGGKSPVWAACLGGLWHHCFSTGHHPSFVLHTSLI